MLAVGADGSVRGRAIPLGRQALADRMAALRVALAVSEETRNARRVHANSEETAYRPLLRQLYDELIAPVARALPGPRARPLVIEPHGPLWLLPFAALLEPDGETWFGDRYALLHAPSAAVLDGIRRMGDFGAREDLSAFLVGNPAMPRIPGRDEFIPLPGAEAEVTQIADLFLVRARVLAGTRATKEAVLSDLPRHGVLHLATHGSAEDEDPLRSFLVFSGTGAEGLLLAEEVMVLSLPADLVVLSACESGLGRVSGEGVLGLSRSFLWAAAQSVVVSLWNVADRATADLMTVLYRRYLAGDQKPAALQTGHAGAASRG